VNGSIRLRLGLRARRGGERAPDALSGDAAGTGEERAQPSAFSDVYRRWAAPVYRYCHVRLGSREAAEDATSTVFLRALAGYEGFRGGSLPAWLFAIARHVVADLARVRPDEPIEVAANHADLGLGPEEVALVGDAADTLAAMLKSLTSEQRQVVELRIAGLTGAEIAEVTGKSEAAVKMLQLRAMQRLRARYGGGSTHGAA
jgi:RNA polymerase sigma-70 factor (ECF subfamily)